MTRGRGAHARIRFTWRSTTANPAGRYELAYDLRPIAAWLVQMPGRKGESRNQTYSGLLTELAGHGVDGESRLACACVLLAFAFNCLGGFRLVDDAIARAWVEALDHYQPVELSWAIEAKRDSLRSESARAMWLGSIRTFPARAGAWLEAAKPYRERLAREAAEIAAARAAKRRAADAALPRADMGALARLVAADAEARAHSREVERRRRADADSAYWESLSEAQRAEALARSGVYSAEACAAAQPHGITGGAVALQLAIDWARCRWAHTPEEPSDD